MRLDTFTRDATETLTSASISTARLDLLVLLEDCLQMDRAHLLAHPELELASEQIRVLNEQIKRRTLHVPLAYIRGKTEFYGREFLVNDYVLEPRPESETMIDVLKTIPETTQATIIDVGTGSGALAITAKLELPNSMVVAIDIDTHCLDLGRRNAKKLHAAIQFMDGDLLQPLAGQLSERSILLCNLPYVPDSFHINQAATHEPRLAIFGGSDGLDVYRRLFRQLSLLARKPQYVLTEAIPPQHEQLTDIAAACWYRAVRSDDFIQLFQPAPR